MQKGWGVRVYGAPIYETQPGKGRTCRGGRLEKECFVLVPFDPAPCHLPDPSRAGICSSRALVK